MDLIEHCLPNIIRNCTLGENLQISPKKHIKCDYYKYTNYYKECNVGGPLVSV